VCPRCKDPLTPGDDAIACEHACGAGPFPIRQGRPVLIDDERSLFARDDFHPTDANPAAPDLLTRLVNALPDTLLNIAPPENLRWLIDLVREKPDALVVVVGCGEGGANMDPLYEAAAQPQAFRLLDLDVSWSSRARAIADGHDLPLPDNSVDGIVCQAVLEHVLDSERVVSELWRVLKPGGRLLAEIPFLQPTHNFPYDFRRYTRAGQRVLFRGFDCAGLGPALGAGSAAARNFEYFLLGLGPNRPRWSVPVRLFSTVCCSWWKYLDRLRPRSTASRDASSGIYFLGTKRQTPLTHKEAFEDFRRIQREPLPKLRFGK
jgi:SAM-dependent methyltransferase